MRNKLALVGLIVLAALVLSVGGTAAPSYPKVNVVVNGHPVSLPGYLIGSYTYVPVRVISETFGAEVGWDDPSKTASVSLFPGDTEPVRSAGRGVLFPISAGQISDAIVYGQANQKQDFPTTFGSYWANPIVDTWVNHGTWYTTGYSDLIHEAFLATPWFSAAYEAWRAAGNGDVAPTPESLVSSSAANMWCNVYFYCNDDGQVPYYKAYIKQNANIIPAPFATYKDGVSMVDTSSGNPMFWKVAGYVTIDPHGLDLSQPFTVMLIDPRGNSFEWSWNLIDLK